MVILALGIQNHNCQLCFQDMHTRVANYGMRKSFSFSKFQNSERNIPNLPAEWLFPSGGDFKNSNSQSKSNIKNTSSCQYHGFNERITEKLKATISMLMTAVGDNLW